ncbi:phosphoglucomutase (alpha-D-glucose-1,6-bisphosphate-dependent) [Alteromonas sp. a30]|uniref:phosphoglucomutase (alpha-D-glucose-1,6-bisphosphate-dependent) n=1 Tax=Alteromonas sp. a30 TaxID=2730917 RepID=UPI002280DC75|nr:phosphoglucomutase (alpha-D-glucose-1,6-bisphosphate-dependent) [Alteromonas sp. a30]MCY7296356.1 alpha-D-glucose phosphate-specific phosphoglucomutase [Alteromonas sp. a30]
MALHPQAGQPADLEQLCNIPKLVSAYYTYSPDADNPHHAVSFGTSGHRGCALDCTFNDMHIAAICQAIVEYRETNAISGPMYIGMDTHALSEAAFTTAVEVFVANDITVIVQQNGGYTPTPVISHAILNHNKKHEKLADGVVITPSHNPPEDGGFKYNPPNGGPADSDVTKSIEVRANQLIADAGRGIKRLPISRAKQSGLFIEEDFRVNYVNELDQVIDMKAIQQANLKLGTDPLGGAGLSYWDMISDKYGLHIDVVNKRVDPTFSFMHRDKDGKLRMDCSSPYAMAGLINLKDQYDLAFGNDPDFDRHGIVSPSTGILNPNHYLAVAIDYLYQHRPQWNENLKIGKTLVSSSMIDRVAKHLKRSVSEMPVGFKWFVDGMLNSQLGFAGEESAGGIFLRRDGSTWATDKDGITMCLLAAEITAVTGKDPGQYYQRLTQEFGEPAYRRLDVAASPEQKKALSSMTADVISSDGLAGEAITSVQTVAPGNNASIGGVKVSTENGWFAARPSGTESIYKIYAESFKGNEHLSLLIDEAKTLVQGVFEKAKC